MTTFRAGFDSECDECGCMILEGDEVGWNDGVVVHEECMSEEEIEFKMWWDG